jgi:hypothetical protein
MTVLPPELADWMGRVIADAKSRFEDPTACCTFVAVRDAEGREFSIACAEPASRVWGGNDLIAQKELIRALVAAGRITAFAWVTGAYMGAGNGAHDGNYGAHVEWEGGPAFRWDASYRRSGRRSWLGLGALRFDVQCGEPVFKPAVAFAFLDTPATPCGAPTRGPA